MGLRQESETAYKMFAAVLKWGQMRHISYTTNKQTNQPTKQPTKN